MIFLLNLIQPKLLEELLAVVYVSDYKKVTAFAGFLKARSKLSIETTSLKIFIGKIMVETAAMTIMSIPFFHCYKYSFNTQNHNTIWPPPNLLKLHKIY